MISGDNYNVFGLVGDPTLVDEAQIAVNPYRHHYARFRALQQKLNRLFHPEDSVIDCGGVKIGGQEKIAVIAGPCSVEGLDPLLEDARAVKAAGATMLRGGAYKPRTSPLRLPGLGTEGIMDLVEARKETGLPIVSELMAIEASGRVHRKRRSDSGRRAQYAELLICSRCWGTPTSPCCSKRGLANTMEEWLMSAEYIMAGGNENVILCERGIRTFEKYTRNTLDLSVVPIVKKRPICPSSSTLPMPRATGGGWWSPCRWRRSRQALTASSSGASASGSRMVGRRSVADPGTLCQNGPEGAALPPSSTAAVTERSAA